MSMVTLGSAVSVSLGQKPRSRLWSQLCSGKAESEGCRWEGDGMKASGKLGCFVFSGRDLGIFES